MTWRERDGVRGALGRFADGMLLRSAPPDRATIARSSFWPLFDSAVIFLVSQVALAPYWSAVKGGQGFSALVRLFNWALELSTLGSLLFAGMVIINNVGRQGEQDDKPIVLDLDSAVGPGRTELRPNPSTGQAITCMAVLVALIGLVVTGQ